MSNELSIRRASGHDVATLIALCIEHAGFERIDHALRDRDDALAAALDATPAPLLAWLACVDGQAAGYATATIDFSTLDAAHFLHMDCLYVREAWRGRGIGQRLFATLQGFARSCGCAAMQWQTPDWNEDAARFYRRQGAVERRKRRFGLRLEAR